MKIVVNSVLQGAMARMMDLTNRKGGITAVVLQTRAEDLMKGIKVMIEAISCYGAVVRSGFPQKVRRPQGPPGSGIFGLIPLEDCLSTARRPIVPLDLFFWWKARF